MKPWLSGWAYGATLLCILPLDLAAQVVFNAQTTPVIARSQGVTEATAPVNIVAAAAVSVSAGGSFGSSLTVLIDVTYSGAITNSGAPSTTNSFVCSEGTVIGSGAAARSLSEPGVSVTFSNFTCSRGASTFSWSRTANSVGIRIEIPGAGLLTFGAASAPSEILIRGVRINAATLAGASTITAALTAGPAGTASISPSTLIVASLAAGLLTSGADASGFLTTSSFTSLVAACNVVPTPAGATAGLGAGQTLIVGSATAPQFGVRLTEGFAGAFTTRTQETTKSGAEVTTGTRLEVVLTNVPSGISLFAPQLVSNSNLGLRLIGVSGASATVASRFDAVAGVVTISYEVITSTPSGSAPSTMTVPISITGTTPVGTGAISGAIRLGPVTSGVVQFSDSPVNVANFLTVAACNLQAAPASVSFTGVAAGANPAPATVQVTATAGAFNVAVATSTATGGNWLTVTQSSGATPLTLTFGANISGLGPGLFSGEAVLTAAGAQNSPLRIPVTLEITASLTPLLSVSPASFAVVALQGDAPIRRALQLTSNGPSFNWTARFDSVAPAWASISPTAGTVSGTQSSALALEITPTVLTAPGTFLGSVVITASGAQNSPISIPVALELNAAGAAMLAVAPLALNLTAALGAAPSRHSAQISTSGAAQNWTARLDIANGPAWASITPASGTASASQPSLLSIDVNPRVLSAAGTYQATMTITNAATAAVIVVPVTLAAATAGPLLVSHDAFVFTARQGGQSPPPQIETLLASAPASWTIRVAAGELQSRISVSPSSGTAAPSPAPRSESAISVNTSGLTAGVYQNVLEIESGGELRIVTVTARIVEESVPALAVLHPQGLLFVAQQGAAAPAPRTVSLANSGGGSLSFQFASSAAFVTVSPASGSVIEGGTNIQISLNPAGLAPGIYPARVTGTFSSGPAQEIAVVLIVTAAAAPTSGRFAADAGETPAPPGNAPAPPANAACGETLEAVPLTFGSGLSLAVSYPRMLVVELVDNCGVPVSNASVNARILAQNSAENIALRALDRGLYSGLWTPARAAASVPITLTASHPSFVSTARQTFSVSVSNPAPGTELPVLFTDGVVEGAGFAQRRPLAPGGIISLFGSGLATSNASATRVPLERELASVTVRFGSMSAPMYFAGAGQVNAQVPFEVSGAGRVSLLMSVRGRFTAPQLYLLAQAQPGIFLVGSGPAVLDSQFRLITAANPARVGETLQIFVTGLGEVTPAVPTGAATSELTSVRAPVTVLIGGIEVTPAFAGLAPGFVGLYQVNVAIPAAAPTGDAVSLVLRQNGVTSNPGQTLTIPVRGQ